MPEHHDPLLSPALDGPTASAGRHSVGQSPTGQTPTGQSPTGQTPEGRAPEGQSSRGQASGTPAPGELGSAGHGSATHDPVSDRVRRGADGLRTLIAEATRARTDRAEAGGSDGASAVCAWNHFENIPTFYNWNNRPR